MPSLKDLRNRIASVKATQKITKAMQMVAAAKLRRAQSAAEAARPYAERMAAVLGQPRVRHHRRARDAALLAGTGSDDVHLLVVCTAERGLCGAFNSSIARLARDHANRLLAEGKTVKIICVGKKGYDILRRQFAEQIIELIDLRSVRQLGFEQADMIAQKILRLFEAGEFDVGDAVLLALPLGDRPDPDGAADHPGPDRRPAPARPTRSTSTSPKKARSSTTLLPRNITMQIFRALLENAASEQGARMSAMDNATRNAGEMIKKQTMTYNRSRQAMITKELIEIISGAEAL